MGSLTNVDLNDYTICFGAVTFARHSIRFVGWMFLPFQIEKQRRQIQKNPAVSFLDFLDKQLLIQILVQYFLFRETIRQVGLLSIKQNSYFYVDYVIKSTAVNVLQRNQRFKAFKNHIWWISMF